MGNQGIFYFVEGGGRLSQPKNKMSAIPNDGYDVDL